MLDHLASLLARPEEASPLAATTDAPRTQANSGWTDEVWRNIWHDVTENARKLLITLAEHPEERLALRKIAAFMGVETNDVQAALSSLTKRMKSYDLSQWPFTYRKDSQTGRYRYWMDANIAGIVLALAGDARGETTDSE
jgi:hypothetical protein